MFSCGRYFEVRLRQGKDGRMKYHRTALVFSIAPCNVSRLFCPQCQDLIIAATKSQYISANEVRHWWACETCGYEFGTTARWQSPRLQSVSAAGETVPLQSHGDSCPEAVSPGA